VGLFQGSEPAARAGERHVAVEGAAHRSVCRGASETNVAANVATAAVLVLVTVIGTGTNEIAIVFAPATRGGLWWWRQGGLSGKGGWARDQT